MNFFRNEQGLRVIDVDNNSFLNHERSHEDKFLVNFQTNINGSSYQTGSPTSRVKMSTFNPTPTMEKTSVIQRLSLTSNSKPDVSNVLKNGSWNNRDNSFNNQHTLPEIKEIEENRNSREIQDMPNLVINSKDFSFPEKDVVR